ncbi:MAG: hypothetical protein SGARI_002559 [Bacillariaceae sp.]
MDALLGDIFSSPSTRDNIRSLAASVLFRAPIVREWCLLTGGIDARKSVAHAALARGRSLIVRPGGLAEQLRTTWGREIVYLKSRKGFLKLAMQHNSVPVVPFFAIREWIQKKCGVALPLAVGYWGSQCPLPVATTVVFGAPLKLDCKNAEAPTQAEIDAAHKKFCDSLRALFDSHKGDLGYGDRELEIV